MILDYVPISGYSAVILLVLSLRLQALLILNWYIQLQKILLSGKDKIRKTKQESKLEDCNEKPKCKNINIDKKFIDKLLNCQKSNCNKELYQ